MALPTHVEHAVRRGVAHALVPLIEHVSQIVILSEAAKNAGPHIHPQYEGEIGLRRLLAGTHVPPFHQVFSRGMLLESVGRAKRRVEQKTEDAVAKGTSEARAWLKLAVLLKGVQAPPKPEVEAEVRARINAALQTTESRVKEPDVKRLAKRRAARAASIPVLTADTTRIAMRELVRDAIPKPHPEYARILESTIRKLGVAHASFRALDDQVLAYSANANTNLGPVPKMSEIHEVLEALDKIQEQIPPKLMHARDEAHDSYTRLQARLVEAFLYHRPRAYDAARFSTAMERVLEDAHRHSTLAWRAAHPS